MLISFFLSEYVKTLENREYLKMVFSEFVNGISKLNIDNEFEDYVYKSGGKTSTPKSPESTEKHCQFKIIKGFYQNASSPWVTLRGGSIIRNSEGKSRRSMIATKSDRKKCKITSYEISPGNYVEDISTPAERLEQLREICMGFMKRLDPYNVYAYNNQMFLQKDNCILQNQAKFKGSLYTYSAIV